MYYYSYRSDTIIVGGGSVFHSVAGIQDKLRIITLGKKKIVVGMGLSLGPFENKSAEALCAQWLNRAHFVGVRDTRSLEIARTIAPKANVVKTFDLAAQLIRNVTFCEGQKRRGLGLALCGWEKFTVGGIINEPIQRKKVINLLKKILVSRNIEELVLLNFNGHKYYGDNSVHLEIKEALKSFVPVRLVQYSPDPMIFLNEIARLRGIVAMRLHAAVFAYLTKTPAIIVSYHPKCREWANEIGLSSSWILDSPGFSEELLSSRIESIFNGDYGFPSLLLNSAVELSMKNWDWVSDFINDGANNFRNV